MGRRPGALPRRAPAGAPSPGPERVRGRDAVRVAQLRGRGTCWPPWPAVAWPRRLPPRLLAAGRSRPALLAAAVRRRLPASFGLGLWSASRLRAADLWLVASPGRVGGPGGGRALIFGLLMVGQRLLLQLRLGPLAVADLVRSGRGGAPHLALCLTIQQAAISSAASTHRSSVALGGPPLLSFLVALASATATSVMLAPVRPYPYGAGRDGWPPPAWPPGKAWPWAAGAGPANQRPAAAARKSPPSRGMPRTPRTCRACSGRAPGHAGPRPRDPGPRRPGRLQRRRGPGGTGRELDRPGPGPVPADLLDDRISSRRRAPSRSWSAPCCRTRYDARTVAASRAQWPST